MIDTDAIGKMVREQISITVADRVVELTNDTVWIESLEQKIIKFIQDRIIGKFNNGEAMQELTSTVKNSVQELFLQGQIPGVGQYIDATIIRQAADIAVEQTMASAIVELGKDSVWLEKIERMINQSVVQRTVAGLSSIDVNQVIQQRVDEQLLEIKRDLVPGIQDQSSRYELTIRDGNVVVENQLTTKNLEVIGDCILNGGLVIKGTINTDNRSWDTLADNISEKTLGKLTSSFTQGVVDTVTKTIQSDGIDFANVKINGISLIEGNTLAKTVTDTNIQSLGVLKGLKVSGPADINNTLHIVNRRIGINTAEPEMALSLWDEEVSLLAGKAGVNRAYFGTSRLQNLAIGINRQAQIEIDVDGLTTIKKLRVGQHQFAHGAVVPNYTGNKGDIVFNTSFGADKVFAWVCIGGFRWQTLKSA